MDEDEELYQCALCLETPLTPEEIVHHFRLFHPEKWEEVQEAIARRVNGQWN